MMTMLLALSGLCLGSFFHVIIQRKDWYRGRSRCDACGYTLKWYDMIPVVSYILLGGRCRKCRGCIEISHFACEIFFGCGFTVAAQYFMQNHLIGIHILAAVIFLGICAVSDIRTRDISVLWLNGGIFTLALLRCVIHLCLADYMGLFYTIAGGVLLYATFYFISKAAEGYVGEGDFDILLMLYFVFGLYNMIACVTIASVIGTCLYLPLLVGGRYDKKTPLPLAPLIYVAFIINLIMRGGILF